MRVCANRINANSRAAGWLPQDNKNHYEIAWSGLRPGLTSKIKPLTPKNGRFDRMAELFDWAVDSEVKLDGKKPQPQRPQPQQRQSGESSQEGGKKHNLQPSISEPTETVKLDKSKSDKDEKCTPAPWVSPELSETRKLEGKCTRCRLPEHITFTCKPSTSANFPDNFAPPGDGKHIKCQHCFNSQQPNA